ncbi:MAG: hypothetical protein KC434_18595, partial [Anaerolineales bacterium]|nr:hypothetical protein [Anaerolineales bacterium]
VCQIASEPLNRPVSFFFFVRRIGQVTEIKSFMRKSVHKTSVWRHPHLVGYIEVGEIVQPIINRDDFVRTYGRTLLYEALLPVEAKLKTLLAAVNEERRENTFAQFEQTVQQALKAAASETSPFDVTFGEKKDEVRRVWWENGRLTINTSHPDFQARLRTSRLGNPRPSDRMNAYLAGVLSVYGTAELADVEERAAKQIDLMLTLEAELREMQKQ